MPSPTICTISGLVTDTTGTPIEGVVIAALLTRPYIDPTSGALIPNYEISTTTMSDGTWTLNLVETTTSETSVTIAFEYPLSSGSGNARYEYVITVPNAATANFSDLVTGQT